MTSGQAYGTAASYFGGGAGAAGGGGGGGSLNSTASQKSGADAVQGGNASSGSGWISAAMSNTQSDKSVFATTFNQSFGGIANNQIINSPGATGAVNNAPITGSDPLASLASGGDPVMLIGVVLAGIALIFWAKGR